MIINKPIRLIELFSGYGSQLMALKVLAHENNIPIVSWKTCEWEANVISSYKEVHFPNDSNDYSKNLSKEEIENKLLAWGISDDCKNYMNESQIKRKSEKWLRYIYNCIKATHNLVDITRVHAADLDIKDTDKYDYIVTYSFPCTSLSNAGKKKGMDKNSGTRSGLLWEFERILDEQYKMNNDEMPKVLVMENVPQVHSKTNEHNFNMWIDKLKSLGYENYWKDLNAKDYGVPQNRKRCIMVSVLGGGQQYTFEQAFKLNMSLGDILEDSPTQKYANNGYKYSFEKVFDNKDESVFNTK